MSSGAAEGASANADRMRSVREFGEQRQHDTEHAEQVCRLALILFDALHGELALDPAQRDVLEAAALLHDVGYHVSCEQHHKHSYHLIAHAELPGFCASDRRLIAAVARYHAGSLPKAKHKAIASLDPDDREAVSRLAALLRIADGLDRSHAGRVTHLAAEVRDGRLHLTVNGRGPVDIEAVAAVRKADLFERVWGMRVEIAEG